MTRKDYIQVAESLAKCAGGLGQDNLLYVADMIAVNMQGQNQAFDYDLFLKNAGVSKETIERNKG
jgi:hypothetical protein